MEYKEHKKGEEESKYQPNTFLEYSCTAILNTFVVPNEWDLYVKKQIDLKKEKRDFYQNKDDIINQIDQRYTKNVMNIQQRYDISLFSQSRDRQALQDLVVILGWVTQIEEDEAMVTMAYNIVEVYIFYEFIYLISNEVRKNYLASTSQILGTPLIFGG